MGDPTTARLIQMAVAGVRSTADGDMAEQAVVLAHTAPGRRCFCLSLTVSGVTLVVDNLDGTYKRVRERHLSTLMRVLQCCERR